MKGKLKCTNEPQNKVQSSCSPQCYFSLDNMHNFTVLILKHFTEQFLWCRKRWLHRRPRGTRSKICFDQDPFSPGLLLCKNISGEFMQCRATAASQEQGEAGWRRYNLFSFLPGVEASWLLSRLWRWVPERKPTVHVSLGRSRRKIRRKRVRWRWKEWFEDVL